MKHVVQTTALKDKIDREEYLSRECMQEGSKGGRDTGKTEEKTIVF